MVKPNRSADPISRICHWTQRRRAIKRYLTILPRRLNQDYGHRGPYTPMRIEASIARHKISSPGYADFAVALFCDPAQLKDFRREDGRDPNHEAIRWELSGEYFDGEVDFKLSDVARLSAEHGGGHH